MKNFVCFAVCFAVGLFACQTLKAQSIENGSTVVEQSTTLASVAQCQQGCDCCGTPIRTAVKNALHGVRHVGCRTMTFVRKSACRVRCGTKRVLANTRRLTQRVFRGRCCN